MTKEEYQKVLELVTTHFEHDGSYCDTGEDMDWSCRSKCTELAVKRLNKEFENIIN